MKIYPFSFLILCFLIACQSNISETHEQHSVDELFEAYHEFKARINPIEATKAGDYRYNDHVANYISDAYQEDLKKQYQVFLDTIATIEMEQLSEADQLSLRVMKWDSEMKLEGLRNSIVTISSPMFDLPTFELMPIIQITSLQLYFSQLAGGRSVQPFRNKEDYINWLKRIDDYLIWIDTAIEKMEEGISKNIVLPKVLTERVITQLEGFVKPIVEDHIFFAPIKLLPNNISTVDQEVLTSEFRNKITDQIIPKYQKLKRYLEEQYLPKGRTTSGIGSLPNGAATYNYLIGLHTSTDMSADEIHELGKREVARIEKEMEKVKTELGFDGDLRAFLNHIRTNPELTPFNDPEEVIANFNAIHQKMKPQIKALFDIKPKAEFEVRRTEAFREQSASAEYVPGTKDASRPGTFYVPIPDVRAHNIFMDEALFLHEAIPGHHFQLSLQQENQQLPEFLHAEGMGVFVEGWALYSESLGKEMGLYTDPYQYFGMLSMEMHRAIRLVVDSGIHAKGWTREQAIQYSMEHEADSEASITSEIERYMAVPGQALSYKIGQLKIQELRERASKALEERFSIKEFHNQVLNSGSLPMELLEEKIDNWIATSSEDAM